VVSFLVLNYMYLCMYITVLFFVYSFHLMQLLSEVYEMAFLGLQVRSAMTQCLYVDIVGNVALLGDADSK
jgi:hypothetical protein